MTKYEIAHPPIVSRDEWLAARKQLLDHEKEQTYRTMAEMAAAKGHEVFHTSSAFARGTESLGDAYRLLDMTPYGRQQEFEDSPAGWLQHPT